VENVYKEVTGRVESCKQHGKEIAGI